MTDASTPTSPPTPLDHDSREARLERALKALPYECRGVLRGPAENHQPDCPRGLIEVALAYRSPERRDSRFSGWHLRLCDRSGTVLVEGPIFDGVFDETVTTTGTLAMYRLVRDGSLFRDGHLLRLGVSYEGVYIHPIYLPTLAVIAGSDRICGLTLPAEFFDEPVAGSSAMYRAIADSDRVLGIDLTELSEETSVDHPAHYGGDTPYEAIKVIEAWGLGFSLGNAAKYICRAGKKVTGTRLEDLKKARWYLDRAIQNVTEEQLR